MSTQTGTGRVGSTYEFITAHRDRYGVRVSGEGRAARNRVRGRLPHTRSRRRSADRRVRRLAAGIRMPGLSRRDFVVMGCAPLRDTSLQCGQSPISVDDPVQNWNRSDSS
jgi:hypothetical protein